MTQQERFTIETVVRKHIDAMEDELSEYDVGYWPDDTSALVAVVMAVLDHQARINEYHVANETNFK